MQHHGSEQTTCQNGHRAKQKHNLYLCIKLLILFIMQEHVLVQEELLAATCLFQQVFALSLTDN